MATRFNLRKLLFAVTALAIAMGIYVNWPFVSSKQVYGVKVGMTESEVVRVMGRHYNESRHDQNGYYWVWSRWPFHVAVVYFSASGRVTEAFND